LGAPENGAEKGDIFMSYLVTIIGFVGADPEQRQARNNGSKFTVLSVATQRSWKNAEDEWVSKVERHRVVVIWNLRSLQSLMDTL
jgi:single-stranded DNA-binding protein